MVSSGALLYKTGVLKNVAKFKGNTCAEVFPFKHNYKPEVKETLTHVFSREFYRKTLDGYFHKLKSACYSCSKDFGKSLRKDRKWCSFQKYVDYLGRLSGKFPWCSLTLVWF